MLLHLQKPKRGARQDPARRRLLLFLIAATLPLIPAAFLSDYLDPLFYDTFFIGFALIATGLSGCWPPTATATETRRKRP